MSWPWKTKWQRDVETAIWLIQESVSDIKGDISTLDTAQFKQGQEIKTMDAVAQKLSDDLNSLTTTVTTALTDIAAEIAALKAQIAAGVPATDDDLTALDAKVAAISAAVTAADPGTAPA